jgi:hypothetical protein
LFKPSIRFEEDILVPTLWTSLDKDILVPVPGTTRGEGWPSFDF